MDPRTEEEAEAGTLTVFMGGKPYTLPVLTIAESEDWQAALVQQLQTIDIPEGGDGITQMQAIIGGGTKAKMAVLLAYDHSGVLGGADNVRKHMTQQELRRAVDTLIEVEFPFETDAARSVAEAFGLPMRAMGAYLRQAVDVRASLSGNSASGPSPIGVSPTTVSVANGRRNNSRSAGPTASTGSVGKPKSG